MEVYRSHIDSVEQIIQARNRIQLICEELGFNTTERLQVATCIFELGKWILEQGEGDVVASLRTDGDELVIEMEALSPQVELSPEEIEELLPQSSSASVSALKGIPAIRRLMDEMDICSLPTGGTKIQVTKRRTGASRKLAKNLVGFLQKKFHSLNAPSVYEDLRAQNTNIAQSLSLIEEKAQELERKNVELNQAREALEEKTAELQQALLSLGDRTAELSAQNKRFNAVLAHTSEGVLVTDRAGTVVEVNDSLLRLFGWKRDQALDMLSQDLCATLAKFSEKNASEWKSSWNQLLRNPESVWTAQLHTEQGTVSCRSMPITALDPACQGRVWIFS